MPNPETPDIDENPYHPFEETERYRAFQEGWTARYNRRSPAANPYALSRPEVALAWLDGWTALEEHPQPVNG